MEKRLSETDKEKIKKIAIIIAIILLLLIILLFFLLYKKTYEVTFDSNGGSEVASVKVKENDKVEEPEDPTREGYTFVGWYYLDELYDFDLPVKYDMTLKAEWEEQGDAEVEGISLNATDLTLALDGTANLVATLQPEDAKQVKLIWTSSDESIATVDENGNVKALKEGTVTITVKTEDEKYTASCTITISKETEEVTTEGTEEGNAGETAQTNTSDNNKKPSTSSTPSNPSSPSTQVNPSTPSTPNTPSTPSTIEPSSVSISGANSVTEGSSIYLTATVYPTNATNKNVTWSSNNTGVATVDQSGRVTGIRAGTVTITVTTSNGRTATYTVTVNAKPANYSIVFTRVRQEGTNNVMQYTYVVYKNGSSFSGYLGFNCGGTQTRKGSTYVSLKSEPGTASLTLSDGTIVTATVTYQG